NSSLWSGENLQSMQALAVPALIRKKVIKKTGFALVIPSSPIFPLFYLHFCTRPLRTTHQIK
ncbi:MAG: hypothetical protein AAF740_15160, partial [Bacteroidota bacterium]